jgi:glycosyltransferase involved in cell wall biosynthesis
MKRNRLRVLLLADASTFHTERFARQLKQQACHVVLASLEGGDISHIRLRRLAPTQGLYYTLAIPQVRAIIRRFRPDVVNAHYASGYGFIAAGAIRGESPPIVLNLWGSDILVAPWKSSLHRVKPAMAVKRARYVLGDSQYLLDTAASVHELKAFRVIPWGVEREYLGLHKESYALHTPLRIIVPRKHERIYNNSFIIEALAPLVNDGAIEVTFPEFGSLAGRFKKQASSLVRAGLRYYSKLSRGEFMALMAGHDVFLSAALSDSSPASLIEAMALGLVPVCADIRGVREWLTAESGFSFQQNDAGQLRSVISFLAHSQKAFEDLRRRNFERVCEKAVFEGNVREQISIMKDVAGKD